MPEAENKSWLRRRAEGAIRGGLTRGYEAVRVDPERFLMQLRGANGLPISTFGEVHTLPVEQLYGLGHQLFADGDFAASVKPELQDGPS